MLKLLASQYSIIFTLTLSYKQENNKVKELVLDSNVSPQNHKNSSPSHHSFSLTQDFYLLAPACLAAKVGDIVHRGFL
jgi:hypothetical protein